jgi:hypothetical protein
MGQVSCASSRYKEQGNKERSTCYCGEIAFTSFETPRQGCALTGASMRYAFLNECMLLIVAFMAFLSVVQVLSSSGTGGKILCKFNQLKFL